MFNGHDDLCKLTLETDPVGVDNSLGCARRNNHKASFCFPVWKSVISRVRCFDLSVGLRIRLARDLDLEMIESLWLKLWHTHAVRARAKSLTCAGRTGFVDCVCVRLAYLFVAG